jgi:hypothetical protein
VVTRQEKSGKLATAASATEQAMALKMRRSSRLSEPARGRLLPELFTIVFISKAADFTREID